MPKTLEDYKIVAPAELGEHWIACPVCKDEKLRKFPEARCMYVLRGEAASRWECWMCGAEGDTDVGITCAGGGYFFGEAAKHRLKDILTPSDKEFDPKALKTLTRRTLTEAAIARSRIGFKKSAWFEPIEAAVPSLTFPYYLNGRLEAIKYVTASGAYWLAGGPASGLLFGIDDLTYQVRPGQIVPQDTAFVVTGELNKVAMDVAGFENSVAMPFTPAKDEKFDHYYQLFEASNYKLPDDDEQGVIDRIQTIFLAIDNDERGLKLEAELIRRLGPDRCVRVRWPKLPLDHSPVLLWDGRKTIQPGDTLKDASEVLYCLGPEAIQLAIQNAKPVPIDGVYTVDDFEEELDSYYEHGLPPGISVGGKAFEDAEGKHRLQLQTKTTWVVTGIPGHGKSRWVENIMIDLARDADWKIAHFSPEVRPLALQTSYFESQYLGLPFEKGSRTRMTFEQHTQAKRWVRDHFFFYEAGLLPFSVDDLLAMSTKLVKKFGIRAVVFDPWNNIYHARRHNEREDEYIGQALQKINAWRAKFDCWVCIVAHPTKMKAIGQEPVPTMNDIKGGSEFYAMSDFGFSVWRNKLNENEASQVHIQKSKFHHLATLGVAQQSFDKPTMRFEYAGQPFGAVPSKKISREGERERATAPFYPEEEPRYWMQGKDYEL